MGIFNTKSITGTLNSIRVPEKRVFSYKVMLGLAVSGILMGIIAQLSGLWNQAWLVEVMQSFGLWIFSITIIACFSKSPKQAFIYLSIFLFSMILAYYLLPLVLYGVFSTASFCLWSIFGAVAAIGGMVLWYGRGKGILSAFILSLPFALICAEIVFVIALALHDLLRTVIIGYFSIATDIFMLLILITAIPLNKTQRILSMAFALPLIVSFILIIARWCF